VELGETPAVTEGIGADDVSLLPRGEDDTGGFRRRPGLTLQPAVVEAKRNGIGRGERGDLNTEDGEELIDRRVAGVRVREGVRADADIALPLLEDSPGHSGPQVPAVGPDFLGEAGQGQQEENWKEDGQQGHYDHNFSHRVVLHLNARGELQN
jgi:hypothetical protein